MGGVPALRLSPKRERDTYMPRLLPTYAADDKYLGMFGCYDNERVEADDATIFYNVRLRNASFLV